MKVILFKKPTDSDLFKGQRVCYMDSYDIFNKNGVITDIETDEFGIKTYSVPTSMGKTDGR